MKYDMKNVRVLLAGNNAKDLVDAEKFLRGKGFEGKLRMSNILNVLVGTMTMTKTV